MGNQTFISTTSAKRGGDLSRYFHICKHVFPNSKFCYFLENDVHRFHFQGHVHNDGWHEVAVHAALLHSQVSSKKVKVEKFQNKKEGKWKIQSKSESEKS